MTRGWSCACVHFTSGGVFPSPAEPGWQPSLGSEGLEQLWALQASTSVPVAREGSMLGWEGAPWALLKLLSLEVLHSWVVIVLPTLSPQIPPAQGVGRLPLACPVGLVQQAGPGWDGGPVSCTSPHSRVSLPWRSLLGSGPKACSLDPRLPRC